MSDRATQPNPRAALRARRSARAAALPAIGPRSQDMVVHQVVPNVGATLLD